MPLLLIGLSAYTSPYTVWADKLGKIPPIKDNEAMRQGRDLEDYVALRFAEKTGKKVRRENNILINISIPFAHANVDRIIIGEDAGLECKTTTVLNMKKFKNGEYPENYYVQCMHYMMVTGCKRWYLAVLISGKDFLVFEINRDESEIEALMKAEKDFWHYVETRTPPPADGMNSTSNTIAAIFPENNEYCCDLSAFTGDLNEYIAISDSLKTLEKTKEELINRIKSFMGEYGMGTVGNYRVLWKGQTRKAFDTKAFAEDHPEIDMSKYYKTTQIRPFKVMEAEN